MRSVDVMDGIRLVGLDLHARIPPRAAGWLGLGKVWKAQLPGSSAAIIAWLATLPDELRVVCGAGPTVFGLARPARAAGLEVMVCSPGAIPVSRAIGSRLTRVTRLSSPGCT